LQVLESLNEYAEPVVEIYFYGLTDNPTLLDAVKSAVSWWADEEIDEADVQVTEAVFILPAVADTLYYLTGSGLTIRDAEIVYTGGREGPQSVWFKGANRHAGVQATAGEFKVMALSRDNFSGEDFLMQYGKAQQAAPQEVERTAPAQEVKQKAVTPGREEVVPKKSSLNFNVEQWLR
jgi:hypothetical protein